MVTLYIIALIMLALGFVLCFKGLKLYKTIQALMCGALGAYIGVMLANQVQRKEVYIVAVILAILGMVLGYKKYKLSLYLCVIVSTFIIVFSGYWKQAEETVHESVGAVMTTKDIIVDSFSNINGAGGILDAINSLTELSMGKTAMVVTSAADMVKHGLLISFIVAVVAGILTVWFADIIIASITAGMGAFLIVHAIELFILLNSKYHLIALVIIGLIGLFEQLSKRRR